MNNENVFYKKVSCSVCGKTGIIKIRKNDGRILSNNFHYFGKINVNSLKTSKNLYKVYIDKNGNMKTEKFKNFSYNKRKKPKYFNYYECDECYMKNNK